MSRAESLLVADISQVFRKFSTLVKGEDPLSEFQSRTVLVSSLNHMNPWNTLATGTFNIHSVFTLISMPLFNVSHLFRVFIFPLPLMHFDVTTLRIFGDV
jgi:hypothetical protein